MNAPDTIAHYRITSKLGEGGMGEVYRATDTKLGREVAIKVLPASVAGDAGRMARFEREAQMLAALNHPNIAAIYGIEQGALVMELVAGDDLKGPVPIETALEYARQIADGLEAAHEKGIIHRDLKPANIKVTPAGQVKLLDFGLAKATEESASAASSATMSPTLSLAMTQAGMILGTAAYMSPEQARGKPVDKRADIWAFGVVLFEMLTGRAMFGGGETVTDIIAAVVRQDPDWKSLPADTPPHVRRVLERCLRKDPKKRMQAIGDVRLLLDEPDEVPAAPVVAAPAAVVKGRPWWGYGAVAVALALALLLWRETRPVDRPMQRFTADLGPGSVAGQRATLAISPDGTRIVFPVQREGSNTMLATRLLDQSQSTILSGTEGASVPFFSPDGQWIAFAADGKLKKVSVQGGAPVPLCDALNLRGAWWGDDGYIVGALESSRLSRVPEAGGTPQLLVKPEPQGSRASRWPQVLPGSQAILFSSSPNSNSWDDANIEVMNIKTGQAKIVQRGGYYGRYLPTGHLVYVHQGTLFAVPFDVSRLETRGMPAPVLDDIAASATSGGGQFDFSRTGSFAYLSGKTSMTALPIQWMDATGKKEPMLTQTAAMLPRFAPDGKRLVVAVNGEIAVYDMERGSLLRLPSSTQSNIWPVWAPDGKHIVYASGGAGLWWTRADGSSQPQKLFDSKTGDIPGSISPDGRHVAFHQGGVGTIRDLWILPLDLADPDLPKPGTPELFLATKGADVEPAFSPDGKWLAYSSNESGAYHVFVRPFPEGAKGGGQAQISTAEGRFPIWSRNGKELFYVTMDGHIMVVTYTTSGQNFLPGKPRQWAAQPIFMMGNNQPLDLASDGKRFAVFPAGETSGGDKTNLHVTFLLNFFDELKRKIPAK